MRRRTTIVLGLVAGTSLLTACGSSATDAGAQPAAGASSTGTTPTPTDQSPAAQPTTTAAPADVADVKAPDFPSGTGQQSASNKGAWDLVLRGVRVSRHDGFDRVVVVFKGAGTPGWSAQYVRTPTADGSGEAVDVRGDNFLDLYASGVTIRNGYPKTPADFFHGPRHFAPEHGGVIEDINVVGWFEGYSQLLLGIDGDKVPFRVFALTNPSRLVVDVKDD